MTKPSQTLGGRLPLADPATLAGAQRDLFEALKATWEPLSNKAGIQMTTAEGRLIGPRVVPQGLYQRARELLGDKGIVDVTVLLGWFTGVSLTLAAYDVPSHAAGLIP